MVTYLWNDRLYSERMSVKSSKSILGIQGSRRVWRNHCIQSNSQEIEDEHFDYDFSFSSRQKNLTTRFYRQHSLYLRLKGSR